MKTPANLAEMAHEETGQWLDSDLLETWVVRRFNRLEQKIRNLESEHEAKVIQNVQLMRERDAYRTAEEAQIALRQKADEREAALAAHVEQLQEYGNQMMKSMDQKQAIQTMKKFEEALQSKHCVALARRDALKQVEAMRHVAKWLSGEIEEGCIGLELGGEISGPTGCSDADRCRVAGERIFREAARIWEYKFVLEAQQ